jgi:tetratricopeptide (TPR) repeat protein
MGSPKEHLLKAVELQPDFSDARYQLAILLEREGDIPAAVSQLEALLQHDPSHPEALKFLSSLSASHGELGAAKAHLEAILENDPRNPDAHFHLAMTSLQANHPHDAVYHFEKTLQQDPDRLEAYFQLGLLHDAPEDFAKARSYFETTVDYEPSHIQGHYHLGLLLQHGKRYNHTGTLMQGGFESEAKKEFEKVINLDPKHAGAHAELGLIQAKSGEPQFAIRNLKEAIRLDSSRIDAWLALVTLLPPAEALSAAKDAVTKHPGHPTLHLRAAQLSAKAKDTERMLHHYRKTIETAKARIPELRDIATDLLSKNQFAKARDADSEIEEYNRCQSEAHFQLALYYEYHNDPEKSRQHLEDGISANPSHYAILHSLAILEEADNNPELAIEYLQKSVEIEIDNPAAHFLLATLLEEKGDIQMAQNHYLITLDLDPGHKGALSRIIPPSA